MNAVSKTNLAAAIAMLVSLALAPTSQAQPGRPQGPQVVSPEVSSNGK